jgi:hypothetical protein
VTQANDATAPAAGKSTEATRGANRMGDDSEVQKVILEQYKLFVGAAEATSGRRLNVNSFYQALHTAIYAAVWAFLVKEFSGFKEQGSVPTLLLALPFAILGVLCVVWWFNIRSYDQLNAKKFQIVGRLEKKLPVQPWSDEWALLERGENRWTYWPLSRLERWVPVVMGLCDIATLVLIVWLVNQLASGGASPPPGAP